ncbi:hypothetical protein KIH41_05310 [Litoribacter ruber]|uniref:hypothetical protein n=1 Tax=Litoribacter ruber TaxID=702568 RepID=UPI001BDB664A|nr:hypothetical protein [Litoribacter ruber]MBT0810693.1 hypothetical protein [Litoribacter ruber]
MSYGPVCQIFCSGLTVLGVCRLGRGAWEPGGEIEWFEEVREMLRGDLRQPEGQLSKTLYYHNMDNSSLRNYVEHLYNSVGREVLRLQLSPERDTISVSVLNYDHQNLLSEIIIYSHPSAVGSPEPTEGRMGKLVWTRTVYQFFDDDRRLSSIELETHYRERELWRTFAYENDLLKRTNYYNQEEIIAYYQYEYENGLKIKESLYEAPFDAARQDWFIHYNDQGLMRAKSTLLMMPPGEMGDVFEYEYDELGRLTEEREYGINWGLPLLARKRLEYF